MFIVGKDIFYANFKPVRDVSVANRFIGAALGVSVKNSRKVEKPKVRDRSPPREDAWDT